jgi:dipeptide/tripeptide permease
MIERFFDKYYLFWLRQYDWMGPKDRLSPNVSGSIIVPLDINIISLSMMIAGNFLADNVFWFVGGVFIAGGIFMVVIDKIYNEKRREELRERYKFERLESRARTKVWVVIYWVLTIAFLLLSFMFIDKKV